MWFLGFFQADTLTATTAKHTDLTHVDVIAVSSNTRSSKNLLPEYCIKRTEQNRVDVAEGSKRKLDDKENSPFSEKACVIDEVVRKEDDKVLKKSKGIRRILRRKSGGTKREYNLRHRE